MQLIYRGETYNYDPAYTTACRPFQPTRTPQSAYELIYRGSTYRVAPTTAIRTAAQPSEYELIYRGNTYQVNCSEQDKVTEIALSEKIYKHRTLTARSAM